MRHVNPAAESFVCTNQSFYSPLESKGVKWSQRASKGAKGSQRSQKEVKGVKWSQRASNGVKVGLNEVMDVFYAVKDETATRVKNLDRQTMASDTKWTSLLKVVARGP